VYSHILYIHTHGWVPADIKKVLYCSNQGLSIRVVQSFRPLWHIESGWNTEVQGARNIFCKYGSGNLLAFLRGRLLEPLSFKCRGDDWVDEPCPLFTDFLSLLNVWTDHVRFFTSFSYPHPTREANSLLCVCFKFEASLYYLRLKILLGLMSNLLRHFGSYVLHPPTALMLHQMRLIRSTSHKTGVALQLPNHLQPPACKVEPFPPISAAHVSGAERNRCRQKLDKPAR